MSESTISHSYIKAQHIAVEAFRLLQINDTHEQMTNAGLWM